MQIRQVSASFENFDSVREIQSREAAASRDTISVDDGPIPLSDRYADTAQRPLVREIQSREAAASRDTISIEVV